MSFFFLGPSLFLILLFCVSQKQQQHHKDFHNFFTRTDAIYFKYRTYGHPDKNVHQKQIEEIHEDLALLAYCARNEPDPETAHFKRIRGGFEELDPFTPIYFRDADYRKQRHALMMGFPRSRHGRLQVQPPYVVLILLALGAGCPLATRASSCTSFALSSTT